MADLEAPTPEDMAVMDRALPFTMTGQARLQALIDSVRYCEHRGLAGAFVECGVWRGGSVLAMILTLQQLGTDAREIFMFDTFEGMTEPSEHDISPFDGAALDIWREAEGRERKPWSEFFDPNTFNLDAVRDTLLATGYPEARLHFVKGPVEQTLPGAAPQEVALLRLDTDWYESTGHELVHLYPRLASRGVLIVDDYGHWAGAQRAVDEYFADDPILLSRIDYTGRIAVKP